MAYDDYEYSVDDSQPDELFDFVYAGDGSHYRITSSAFPITFGSFEYTPVAMERAQIARTGEIGKNGMTIRLDRKNEYFRRYVAGSLTYQTNITLYTLQPDSSFIKAWSGVIKSVSMISKDIEIAASPISTSASRPILHRKYQTQCPHKFGGYYCGANLAPFTETGTIDAVDGTELQSTTFATEADGWFASGTIAIDGEVKTIIKHIGNTITILDPFYNLAAGASFSVVAGCSHDIAICDSKFSNELNYGGFPWIPSDDDITKGKPFTF